MYRLDFEPWNELVDIHYDEKGLLLIRRSNDRPDIEMLVRRRQRAEIDAVLRDLCAIPANPIVAAPAALRR